MADLTITLTDQEYRCLDAFAQQERRTVKAQAEYLVAHYSNHMASLLPATVREPGPLQYQTFPPPPNPIHDHPSYPNPIGHPVGPAPIVNYPTTSPYPAPPTYTPPATDLPWDAPTPMKPPSNPLPPQLPGHLVLHNNGPLACHRVAWRLTRRIAPSEIASLDLIVLQDGTHPTPDTEPICGSCGERVDPYSQADLDYVPLYDLGKATAAERAKIYRECAERTTHEREIEAQASLEHRMKSTDRDSAERRAYEAGTDQMSGTYRRGSVFSALGNAASADVPQASTNEESTISPESSEG